MLKGIAGIYKIASKSHPEREYIGSAGDIRKRWYCHKWDLRNNRHSSPILQRHYNKYGEDDLLFSVVAICKEDDLIPENGIIWIEQLFLWAFKYKTKGIPFFNVCPTAGSSRGLKTPKEVKEKQSKAKKGIPTGRSPWNKGLTVKDYRADQRWHLSEETVVKNKESNKNRPKISEETRNLMSIAHKGHPVTEDTRKKISSKNKGQCYRSGFNHSDDTINKITEGVKKNWEEWKKSGKKRTNGIVSQYTEEEINQRRKIAKIRYRKKIQLMAKLEIHELTVDQLKGAIMPTNNVLVETEITWEGKKSKHGIIVGFQEDMIYAEGKGSLAADMCIPYGIVKKLPQRLWFDEHKDDSMPWETDMQIKEGDAVWFSIMESYNATSILCEGRLFRIIPYQDIHVARRGGFDGDVIVLNGNVLCQTVNCKRISDLDVTSEDKIDPTRAIVRYVGTPNKRYRTETNVDHLDVRPGDEILLDKYFIIFLERKAYFARFDGDNLYTVVPRRRIAMVINREA